MQTIYPDYYKDFECIKGDCRHNCCIGWEIDIDPETAKYYKNLSGDFGKKLKSNINWNGEPCFILGKNERCPFLNKENLCDIIIGLGEEHLCNICADHPRFRNYLPDRVEIGLGLCCEAAARLILGKKSPVSLVENIQTDDKILKMRDKIISLLQNRQKSIENRIEDMLKICNTSLPDKNLGYWAKFLLKLERLDPLWTNVLNMLKENFDCVDYNSFSKHMESRQYEYEQFLVYIIYRHFANATSLEEMESYALFAALSYKLIFSIGAVIKDKTGNFDFEQQIEIARMFSSEIEYSDENLDIILNELY